MWYDDSPLGLLLPGNRFAANRMLSLVALKQHYDTGAVCFKGHGGEHSIANPYRVAHY